MTPSLVQLAETCCCWKSTAARALGHLERHGWVVRNRTTGGRGKKTTYQLAHGWVCGCPERSDSRTVYDQKRSDSRTPKRSDSHTETRRSDPILDVGISEGKNWQGSGWRTNWLAGTEYENRADHG
jgi:hypothetical protein